MTKEQALQKTKDKFTNLMDGKVTSGVSVKTIIDYYESLMTLQSKPVTTSPVKCNFLQNFIEADLQAMMDEEEFEGI